MKRTKTQKGITLIALIITIVVLLILTVVAIREVNGDGIIFKAKDVTSKYTQEQEKELIRLALNEYKTEQYSGKDNIPENFKAYLDTISPDWYDKENSKDNIIVMKKTGNLYNMSGEVSEVTNYTLDTVNNSDNIWAVGNDSDGINVVAKYDAETQTLIISKNGVNSDGVMKASLAYSLWRDNIRSSIKNIEVNEGITKISSSCFDQCTALEKVKLPSTLQTIERDAFYICTNLINVNLPEGLISIGSYAFAGCSKLTVYLHKNITTIGDEAFRNCIKVDFDKEFNFNSSLITNIAFANCSYIFEKYGTGTVSSTEITNPSNSTYKGYTQSLLINGNTRLMYKTYKHYGSTY